MEDVPEVEVAACKDGVEWARLFVARNPNAHVLEVLRVYGHAELTSRLGPLSISVVERVQAEMGAAGLTLEKLEEMNRQIEERRAAREQRNARYLRLTPDELRALADSECVRAASVRLLARGRDATPSAAVRLARAALHVNGEVCNGGFDQFFWNARRDEIQPALEGLRAIGALEAAAVVERAIELERRKYALGMRASGKRGRDHDFDALDKEYYAALPRKEPGQSFDARLAAFIRAHAEDF